MSMLEVLDRIRELEADLEREMSAAQERWHYRIESGRVRFEAEVHRQHRRMKTSIRRFLRESYLPSVLSAPVIYSLAVPLLLLDAWLSLYQRICFPIYGIAPVRRRDYIALDRRKLAYLNGIEKVNCDYCGYANGLFGYAREIAARTEQVLVSDQARAPCPWAALEVP